MKQPLKCLALPHYLNADLPIFSGSPRLLPSTQLPLNPHYQDALDRRTMEKFKVNFATFRLLQHYSHSLETPYGAAQHPIYSLQYHTCREIYAWFIYAFHQ